METNIISKKKIINRKIFDAKKGKNFNYFYFDKICLK